MTTLCIKCGFNNPPGMRFCGNCGARLAAAPEVLPPSTTTPVSTEELGVLMGADLMQRLQKAGVEAAGQRRNVTVLFTDLTGYTALSEHLDGEDLYDLVQQYIHLLLNNVYKYEGIVDKLTGDGLMALFGAPIAHENNAERAVRAALDMQADVNRLSRELKEKLGIELSMRVGLHAGAVVVGSIGSNMLMNYTAIGDTVNLARRIEEAAAPGTILVSETVHRQVKSLFDCQQVTVLNPKGISHPVAAFRVLAPKARAGQVRGIEGLRARMIGRDLELEHLRSALNSLISRKQGQLVLVTGEAGLGKSRLVTEFKNSLGKASPRVLEGHSLAYRRAIPYWIFLDVLHSFLGTTPNTPQSEVRERLMRSTYHTLGSQAAEVLPYFEHLLSLPYSDPASAERLRYLDAGQLRQQIFLAWRDLFLVESYRCPLLLILDDLHWADETSLELLQFLLETLRQAPIYILAISREVIPGTMKKAAEWAAANLAERFQTIQLKHLSLDQSETLLSELLNIPSLPETLREHILQRASGVPLYLEEILRMLIDEGAIQRENGHWRFITGPETDTLALRVPDTLQGLILARFDRLSSLQRRVLQVASVIGKDFNLRVLQCVLQTAHPVDVQSAIEALFQREFILPRSGESEAEYSFRHILMSDAIYANLLRKERSKLHGEVGQALESLYADRLEEYIELLASHYRWSPQLDRALHFSILAGQKTARNNVYEQSRQHFQAALELLQQTNHTLDQALQVQMGLGDALVFTGDYPAAREHYGQGLTGLKAVEVHKHDEHAEARSILYRKIAKTYERQGEYDQALAILEKAQHTLNHAALILPVERALVWNDIGWINFRRGNFSEAQQMLQDALELVEFSDAYDTIASIYNRLGGVSYNQGDWDRAAGFLRKSIAIRESIRDLTGLASSFNNLAYLEIEIGEFDNALEDLNRSHELYTRIGQAEGIAASLNNMGWLQMQRGEVEIADQALNQALELAHQIGYSSLLRQILKNFGELHLATQEWEKASEVLTELAPALVELGANDQLLDTYRLLGEAALGMGDLHAAREWSEKAQGLILTFSSEVDELSAVQRGELRRFRGMLALQEGDWERAGKYLRESEAIFMKLRSRWYQGRIAYQLGALAQAQGDRRSARLRYREAAMLFQSIGAKLEARRAEEAYSLQLA